MRHSNMVVVMLGWATVATLGLCGCAADGPKRSGFLGDYPPMSPSPRAYGAYAWWHPNKNASDYLKFIVDPVTVYMHPDSKADGASAKEQQELADYFQGQIVSRIMSSGKYEIVDQPGAGVLRIRAALTDVEPSKPGSNLSGLGVGGASMEAECIDTHSGERIVAVVATRKGNPADREAGRTRWGHTQEVLKEWAQIMREALDNRWVTDSFGNTKR